MYFLKAALNTIRKSQGLEELDAFDFLTMVRDKMTLMNMDQTLLNRPVNTGFSGGEKKRNEIFQMAVLEPKLAVLDETDSGLDIDALKLVAARREHAAVAGAVDDRGDALPAAAGLHRAGFRARAGRGQDREVGRQGTGAANWRRKVTPGWASKTKTRSPRYDGRVGTDRRVAGGVHRSGGCRALAPGDARGGVHALRGARFSHYPRRRVALHERSAHCARATCRNLLSPASGLTSTPPGNIWQSTPSSDQPSLR